MTCKLCEKQKVWQPTKICYLSTAIDLQGKRAVNRQLNPSHTHHFPPSNPAKKCLERGLHNKTLCLEIGPNSYLIEEKEIPISSSTLAAKCLLFSRDEKAKPHCQFFKCSADTCSCIDTMPSMLQLWWGEVWRPLRKSASLFA